VEDQSSVKKILLGGGVGLAVVFAILACIRVTGKAVVPLPPMIMVASRTTSPAERLLPASRNSFDQR